MDDVPGAGVIKADAILTGVFAITAAYAAVDFSTTAQWIGAATAMALFTVGVFTFLWSYWNAVQRSRTDEIAVSQLYLLLGEAIPKRVRRTLGLLLLAQFAIAAVTTFARLDGPDGNPGSSLAVGFLVPMLGFGMNGMWAVTHGRFAPRADLTPDASTDASTAPGGEDGTNDSPGQAAIGQNADHG